MAGRLPDLRSHLFNGPPASLDADPAVLAALLANLDDGLLVVDAGGFIRSCNAQAWGFLCADRPAVGQRVDDVLASAGAMIVDLETVRTQWRTALERATSRPSFEFAIRRIGEHHDVHVSLFPLGAADVPGGAARDRPGYVGVLLRDVTAQRESDRERSRLISVVSHELRNPITTVLGYAELITSTDYADPHKYHIYGQMIQNESERIMALLDDLMSLDRTEGAGITCTFQAVDLRALLEDTARPFAGKSVRHTIALDLPADLPPVHADPLRLKQIVSNLLSNALKYSPEGGEVRIAARLEPARPASATAPAQAEERQERPHHSVAAGYNGSDKGTGSHSGTGRPRSTDPLVRISVADHGLGIPPEALPQLFTPFYRVESADREGIPGTGLGLAIVHKLVTLHGGRLQVRSTPGRGSTFWFTLPIAPRSEHV